MIINDTKLASFKDMIKLGQEVEFDPFAGIRLCGLSDTRTIVTGKVIYINAPHRWFEVEYPTADGKVKTSFKFDEIGKAVTIVEE